MFRSESRYRDTKNDFGLSESPKTEEVKVNRLRCKKHSKGCTGKLENVAIL